MTADDVLGAVAVLNPGALRRAQRLAAAVSMLAAGTPAKYAVRLMRDRFSIDRVEAWRVVSMASDMAGPVDAKREEAAS
jgi:hypothetical protein